MRSGVITAETKKEYYQALINRDSTYEGLFFVGVKTTGIFCRPTCPARKPHFENCEFYKTVQEALLASFRPCARCTPLAPHGSSPLVQQLVEAIEKNPEKRWKESDFQKLSFDLSTIRRHFKKRFAMTCVAYARARRMGIAMKQIREGESVIQTQLASGYESGSGFRDAFSRILGTPPSKSGRCTLFKAAWIDTALGPMLAVSNEEALLLLEFVDRRGLERELERLRKKMHAAIVPGKTPPLDSIKKELKLYFEGSLKEWKTPMLLIGSPFQIQVWEALKKIPYGHTRSYAELAASLGKPEACRAVGNANGANQLALIIPCHRVIQKNGDLGGYGGGLSRKKWLLELETGKRFGP